MPITSAQVNGLIGGQQAMFGNVATYARQISPGGGGNQAMPTYSNPMMGAGYGMAGMPGTEMYNQGASAAPGMMMGAGTYGMPVMAGAGMMMGGRAGGMIDPFTGGLQGAGRAVGWSRGAGIGANLGRAASMGARVIPRVAAGAAIGAMPALAIAEGARYSFAQMAEGAQFQNQTSGFLQNAFRFTNQSSRTGQGFSRTERQGIGSMMQEMGFGDIMSTPQELLGIMKKGTQMGAFRGIQDAREFREKFKEMKNTLTEIASTFNTTLTDALPFLQQARSQGFWTPQDVTQHARQVRQVQANTGMSAAQAQAMTGVGAQMVRGIGGTGQQGAQMMAKAQGLTGAALFGGTVSSQELQEAGFGQGAEGAQNMGQMMAGMTARFSKSRVGRWALASMMNEEGTGLDAARMSQFTSGGMSVGKMGSLARRNVSGGRAYQFVEHEEEMRGQLAAQGPEAALGMVRSLTGARLHGGSSRDRLVTRRIIQRFMGGTKRQADMIAKMAQDLPRLLELQSARSENSLDQQERQRETMMNDTYEGMKRKIGGWWDKNIHLPMQKAGAIFADRVGRAWEKFTDNLFGTGGRTVNLSETAVRAMSTAAATGDMSALVEGFGSKRLNEAAAMPGLTGGVGANEETMSGLGFSPSGYRGGGMSRFMRGAGMLMGPTSTVVGMAMHATGRGAAQYSAADAREAQGIMSARAGGIGETEAQAAGYGGTEELMEATQGKAAQGIQSFLKSPQAASIRGRATGFRGGFDADSNRRYNKAMVEMIQSGAAGEEAQQALRGLDTRTATTRAFALQGSAADTFGGLQAGEGVGERALQLTRKQIEDNKNDAVDQLTKALRGGVAEVTFETYGHAKAGQAGGIKGVAVTSGAVQEIMKSSDGETAIRLLSEAKVDEDPESAAEKRARAKSMLNDMLSDEGTSKEAQSAILNLMKGGKEVEDGVIAVAGALNQEATFAFRDKSRRRMQRFKKRLGASGRQQLEKAAGSNERLKRTLTRIMEGGGRLSPKDKVTLMTDLARESSRNPEASARIQTILQEHGLEMSEIGLVMGRAGDVNQAIKQYAVGEGGGSMRKMLAGASQLLQMHGITAGKGGAIKKSDIKKLVRGDEGTQKKVHDLLEKQYGEGRADEIIEDLKGGMTKEEIEKHLPRGVAAAGLRTYSDRASRAHRLGESAGLEEGAISITGREGSRQAMGEQLKLQTELGRRQVGLLEKIAGKTWKQIVVVKDPP